MIRLAVLLAIAGCGGGGGGSHSSSACSGSPGTGAPVTITGQLQYEDKAYDLNGFTGATPTKPIRYASVQVVRSCDGTVLNSPPAVSDAGGNYSVTFTNTGPAGVYVRALASAPDWQISVKDPANSLWAITSTGINDTGAAPLTMDLTATTTAGGGVFNLLDVMTSAAEFVKGLTGSGMPPLTVYWPNSQCDGTYFVPPGSIFVLDGCTDGDTDEYDDSVLTHEFGHFVASVYSRDDSPGGIHYLNDNTQDIRLSWSEGWGDFFSSAARNNPLYVDTVGSAAEISFNLEDLSTTMGFNLAADAIYTTNELSVAAVLWDIFDNTPGEVYTNTAGTDAVSAGMPPIWDVIANYFTCTICGITNVSFENFWDGWFIRGHGFSTEMATLVADRKMALTADGFEPDDTPATAAPITVNGAAQTHTLYPGNDGDFVKFTASSAAQHTVETFSLTNGADTLIEIYDSPTLTTLVASNDNWDNKTYGPCGVDSSGNSNCPVNGLAPTGVYSTREPLSSRVQFSAGSGVTYYVRVKRSASAPPSAGVYGSYDLKITSP
jgi:hypothetical protein